MRCPGFGGSFERVNVRHLKSRPDEGDGLRPHAGKTEEFEHGGLVFEEELFAKRHGPGGDQLYNVGCHALADAGDGEELPGLADKGDELSGLLLDGLGGAAIGTNTKRVRCIYFEQGRSFIEQASNGDVIHG